MKSFAPLGANISLPDEPFGAGDIRRVANVGILRVDRLVQMCGADILEIPPSHYVIRNRGSERDELTWARAWTSIQ